MVGTNAPVVKHHLLHPVTVGRPDGAGKLQNVGGVILAEDFLRAVPGAIKADSDAFHGSDLLSLLFPVAPPVNQGATLPTLRRMETAGTSCLVGVDEYLRYVSGRVVSWRRAPELYERVRKTPETA